MSNEIHITDSNGITTYLETDHIMTADEVRELNEVIASCHNLVKVVHIPGEVKKLAKKFQIQKIEVDGKDYEFILSEKAYNETFGECNGVDEITSRLESFGYTCKNNTVYDKTDNMVAKFDLIFGWIQLHPDTKRLDRHIIFSFPRRLKLFLDKYSIKLETAQELCFCGKYDIDFSCWNKLEGE